MVTRQTEYVQRPLVRQDGRLGRPALRRLCGASRSDVDRRRRCQPGGIITSTSGTHQTVENGRTSTRAGQFPWSPRAFAYAVAFRDKIWVLGGQTIPQFAPAEAKFHREIWTTTNGMDWKQVKPQEPYWSARALIGGKAVFQGRIWVIGGGLYDTPKTERTFHNDVWSSADGVHWKQHLAAALWSPRQMHELAVFDDKLWVIGGWNQTNRNDVWYSPDGVKWTELPDTPWKASACSQRVRPQRFSLGGRRQQHDARCLAVTAKITRCRVSHVSSGTPQRTRWAWPSSHTAPTESYHPTGAVGVPPSPPPVVYRLANHCWTSQQVAPTPRSMLCRETTVTALFRFHGAVPVACGSSLRGQLSGRNRASALRISGFVGSSSRPRSAISIAWSKSPVASSISE